MDAKRVTSKRVGLNTALRSVSVDEFLVCSLKWVKYDSVFNVFQRRGPSGYAPEVFHSSIFHPYYLVLRCPLPRFPPLSSGATFSTPAFSTPVFSAPPPGGLTSGSAMHF